MASTRTPDSFVNGMAEVTDRIAKLELKHEKAIDEREKIAKELKEARRERSRLRADDFARRKEEHKGILSEECNVPRGEWFDAAYCIAWEMGHSSGLDEVATHFSEIAQLYKIQLNRA